MNPPQYTEEDESPMLQEVISDPLPQAIIAVPQEEVEEIVTSNCTPAPENHHQVVLYRTSEDCCLKSRVGYRKTDKGVLSRKAKLYKNPDTLWKFLMHHSKERPTLKLFVQGTCGEVTDFQIEIDVTNYIDNHWSYISCDAKYQTVDSMLYQFCTEKKSNKELVAQKAIVGWCEDQVLEEIRCLVISQYRHNVSVYFKHSEDEIAVVKQSWLSWMAQSTFLKFFCLLSCLWLVCWPFYCMISRKVTHRLQINYQIRTTSHYFIEQVAPLIVDTVRFKRQATIQL